jgi:hypothetical protein
VWPAPALAGEGGTIGGLVGVACGGPVGTSGGPVGGLWGGPVGGAYRYIGGEHASHSMGVVPRLRFAF